MYASTFISFYPYNPTRHIGIIEIKIRKNKNKNKTIRVFVLTSFFLFFLFTLAKSHDEWKNFKHRIFLQQPFPLFFFILLLHMLFFSSRVVLSHTLRHAHESVKKNNLQFFFFGYWTCHLFMRRALFFSLAFSSLSCKCIFVVLCCWLVRFSVDFPLDS